MGDSGGAGAWPTTEDGELAALMLGKAASSRSKCINSSS
jgi:hypothetical protein